MIKILKFDKVGKEEIFARNASGRSVAEVVSEIIEKVKDDGDSALFAYCKKFDKADLTALEVSEKEKAKARNETEPEFIEILKEAAKNITIFHSEQKRKGFSIKKKNGVVIGQKITPIEKVGVYVPGGTAAYPSTVLMDVIPAKIAGCKDIIMTTPPDENGEINPTILSAAEIAGVNRIFKIGGAQAIAALAYGTESVPKVDKIVGPGNAFVAEAKKQVFGKVNIDMIAGPSEILVVADGKNDPKFIAADLLSQAEHDKMASAVLITDSAAFAKRVSEEIEERIEKLGRKEIARASIDNNGKIIIAKDLLQAIEISNEIALEHLELCVEDPFYYLEKVKNAGSVFLGRNCPEALGDYFAGPNHTLPTSGTAKFSSPLSVDDFIKKTQFTYYTEKALKKVAEKVAYFAEKEGLSAHAESVLVRLKGKQK
ncbi:MAG: histidinol dehydrogenase [Clostridia bacterium]|nr:histidinol dehydrogenase [Clostridia bacterium]